MPRQTSPAPCFSLRHRVVLSLFAIAALGLTGCDEASRLPAEAGYGPQPNLPAPSPQRIPTVHVAQATGWPEGRQPVAAEGLSVQAFASGLQHPRWLLALPNGDVLVAETNAPPKPEDSKGIRGWFMQRAMKKAGSAGLSANRITLLRDADGDGRAETRTVLRDGLNSPFGMALVGSHLYVANTDAVVRLPFQPGQTRIEAPPEKVLDLPGGPLNHHWTKNLITSADGKRLYITVGSNSNIAENGMDKEEGRAAIWELDLGTKRHRLFATGLRNPNGMAWEGGRLWTVVNERDELGNDLVPDYLTSVQEGGFYGWPYSYWGRHVDERVQPQRPELVAHAIAPDYALGAHTASLGLVNAAGNRLSPAWSQGMFIGQHGSWNRKPRSGYKVVFIPFNDGKPAGAPVDVLTGFLSEAGEAHGRPVGVALDRQGALLVADDVGNVIWRVAGATPRSGAKAP